MFERRDIENGPCVQPYRIITITIIIIVISISIIISHCRRVTRRLRTRRTSAPSPRAAAVNGRRTPSWPNSRLHDNSHTRDGIRPSDRRFSRIIKF